MAFQGRGSTEIISVEQKKRLVDIYNNYHNVFSNSPGKTKNFVFELKFQDSVNFKKKSYPIAQSLKETVRKEILRMVEEEIIGKSSSPYTSPVVAIPKKDGQVCLCLNAREINKMIINDRISPGEIDEIMKEFHGCKFMSTWDAVCGDWQIELHANSRQYVAFIFKGRNYQFKRLPFGLVNSVAIFIQ